MLPLPPNDKDDGDQVGLQFARRPALIAAGGGGSGGGSSEYLRVGIRPTRAANKINGPEAGGRRVARPNACN